MFPTSSQFPPSSKLHIECVCVCVCWCMGEDGRLTLPSIHEDWKICFLLCRIFENILLVYVHTLLNFFCCEFVSIGLSFRITWLKCGYHMATNWLNEGHTPTNQMHTNYQLITALAHELQTKWQKWPQDGCLVLQLRVKESFGYQIPMFSKWLLQSEWMFTIGFHMLIVW